MKNETVFVEVFGNSPVIRVLDFLIYSRDFDYPLTEIAKNSSVSYSTLRSFWRKLEKNNVVIKTGRMGKSDLFRLNINNPAVKQLIKLDWNLIKGSELLGDERKESIGWMILGEESLKKLWDNPYDKMWDTYLRAG